MNGRTRRGIVSAASAQLSPTDRACLRRAVALSGVPKPGGGDLPFGAVVAIGGKIVAEAHNEVASRCDPTAHAEILALRAAAAGQGTATLADAVLYSSSEPCPMCLAACYWARVDRIVHAATVRDAGEHGFEDADFYQQLALPKGERKLHIDAGDGPLRDEAIAVLSRWHKA